MPLRFYVPHTLSLYTANEKKQLLVDGVAQKYMTRTDLMSKLNSVASLF